MPPPDDADLLEGPGSVPTPSGPNRWWLIGGAAAAVLLVAGVVASALLTSSGPPTDASRQDFCSAFEKANQSLTGIDPKDTAGTVQTLHRVGQQLSDVGTPSDISDSARSGFERAIKLFEDLPADATQDDLQQMGQDLSSRDQQNAQAFGNYLVDHCQGQQSSGSD